MTRTSLHALALSIIVCVAAAAGAALPQDRPFYATIKVGAPGAEQCLGFNNGATFPSRGTEHCRPSWRFQPLGNDLFTISHASESGERCLIFGGNGSDISPSRHAWDIGEYCGFPGGKDALLRNRQAVYHITDLGDGRYTISNESAGGDKCVIFGGNGNDPNPSRYNWGSGPFCGFPGGRDALVSNGQAVFQIQAPANGDVLDAIFARLYRHDSGRFLGITYGLTTDNALKENWVQQTPDVWGMEASAVPIGAGRNILNHIRDVIASAQQHVDITTLIHYPTGEFQTVIRQGLEQLARSGRPVTVRILGGWDPLKPFSTNQSDYLHSLIVDIKDRSRFPNNQLQISVGAQREYGLVWNHGKIVAVDGREMLIGGQNFWENDYLRQNPVHDLTIRLRGGATAIAHRYADAIWTGPCSYILPAWKPALWKAGGSVTTGCVTRPSLMPAPPQGTARVLTVARLGLDRLFAVEASELAMVEAFERTTGPIFISQQDVMGTITWDWIQPLAGAVVKSNRPVYIVVGDDGAKGGPAPGETYKLPLRTLAGLTSDLWNSAKGQRGTMTIDQLKDRLCSRLSVATLRFGPSEKWPSGLTFANHAKFWMTDDLFYVGSHNLYPAGLAEIGAIVNDSRAARDMRTQYWNKLWNWSRNAAVSGPDATRPCVFRGMN